MNAPTVTVPSRPLTVRLLGGVDLRLDGEPVGPVGSGRAEHLLAYLLLRPGVPVHREHLAGLLWPESTQAQARTNLRHILHTLRRAFPGLDRFVEADARTLRWRAEAPVWLDVAAFERALADDRQADAVELYTGELLAGRFDDWVLAERERLARRYRDALEQLARTLSEQGHWSEAIRHAESLVRHDPLREEAHRLLIRLCAEGVTGRARCAPTTAALPCCSASLASNLRRRRARRTRACWPRSPSWARLGRASAGRASAGRSRPPGRRSSGEQRSGPGWLRSGAKPSGAGPSWR